MPNRQLELAAPGATEGIAVERLSDSSSLMQHRARGIAAAAQLQSRKADDSAPRTGRIEIIVELVLNVLVEVLGQVLLEFPAEVFGSRQKSRHHVAEKRRPLHPALALGGCALAGAAVGVIGASLFPQRLLPFRGIPGVSMVIAPVATGAVMHMYGRWRRGRGLNTTILATYWGASTFAWAMALARFLMVR